jgi:hypothetical protein
MCVCHEGPCIQPDLAGQKAVALMGIAATTCRDVMDHCICNSLLNDLNYSTILCKEPHVVEWRAKLLFVLRQEEVNICMYSIKADVQQ